MTPETSTFAASLPPVAAPRSRRKLWIALIVLLLLAGGAGAWWLWRPRSAPPAPPPPRDVADPAVLQVIERARRKVTDNPRSAVAWGELGMTLLAYLSFPEADRCFAEAHLLEPDSARWLYYRYTIATRLDPVHAVDLLRQAQKAGGVPSEERSTVRLQLADVLLERQELAEAEKLYRAELQIWPDNPRALLGLGQIAAQRGDTKRAVELLTRLQGNPNVRKKATAELAALASASGDPTLAEKYEKEYLALPADTEWLDPFFQALARYRVGQKQVRDDMNQLEHEGRYKEAAEAYLERLETEPSVVAYVGAGFNLAQDGQFDRAMPLLEKAIRLDPDNSGTHYRLAQVLFLRAENEHDAQRSAQWFDAAAKAAERSTQLKPDRADSYLLWGKARLNLKQTAAALEPLQKGVECRPESFMLQLTLGQALLEAKHFGEAETHLENARQLNPKDPRAAQLLRQLQEMQK